MEPIRNLEKKMMDVSIVEKKDIGQVDVLRRGMVIVFNRADTIVIETDVSDAIGEDIFKNIVIKVDIHQVVEIIREEGDKVVVGVVVDMM